MSKKSREKRKQSEAEWLELCEKIEAETKPKKHFIDTFVESADTIDDIRFFIEERCSDFDKKSYRVTVDIVEERLIPLMPLIPLNNQSLKTFITQNIEYQYFNT